MLRAGQLSQYEKRRTVRRSGEPPGIVKKSGPIFVIQKHAASHLHYDVRLSIDGVLVSWAVPKGPSTSTSVKRLAVRTDDHPMAYANFEGVIPEGEYGAGTVMVWDKGTYKNIKKHEGKVVPMSECLSRGTIEVWLEGTKLQGGYAFIRMQGKKEQWLMIKMKDAAARERGNPVATKTKSALTGRTMKQIEADESDDDPHEVGEDVIEKRKVGARTLELTNLDRMIFPRVKITKRAVLEYYEQVAPRMLPHMRDRLLTMQRFVNGVDEEGFYQKNASDYFPTWIRTKAVAKQEDGDVQYVICDDLATLMYLANQLTLTFHLWLSRVDKLQYPDRMIFDLDPSEPGFAAVRKAARQLKQVLEDELGLTTFIMTTGSRGVHVMVPLDRTASFATVRTFAHDVAQLMALRYPQTLTIEMRKAKRCKRVFVDYLRNAFAATGVAPYAVRATQKASIATPISWDELGKVQADSFTIKNIGKRLQKQECPWKSVHTYACSLKQARMRVRELLKEEGHFGHK